MRTLQNICNEFVVYKNTLGCEISLSDDLMFAIIAFKNLYPKDFSELQNESGIVKRSFEDKQQFVRVQTESIQKNIDHDEDILKRMDSDTLQSSREIKTAMLLAIAENNHIVTRICSYTPSYNVNYDTIMRNDYNLLSLKDIKDCRVYYRPLFRVHTAMILINISKIYSLLFQIILIGGRPFARGRHERLKLSKTILLLVKNSREIFQKNL